jgi:hypothetical protein
MKTILHKFVTFVPDELEYGVLYVTVEYRTAVHLCVCGCGNKVVTPLSPTDWTLIFDGKSVTLSPSIGNWSFKCKSHYWIRKDHIYNAGKWAEKRIESGRIEARKNKEKYFSMTKPKLKKKDLKH